MGQADDAQSVAMRQHNGWYDGDAMSAVAAVEQTLARLEQDDPATSADVDAIRLALHYSR